jgi:FkbM family methyltransferase
MLQKLFQRLTRGKPIPKSTRYIWKSVETGIFSGLTLYLPEEWGEEVIQGQHEKEFLEVIQLMAPKCGVFYDIGAHYGWFTAAWLQYRGECVEAFEPLAENRIVMEQMLSYNHWEDKVHIHSVAIGRNTGMDWLIAYPGDSSRTFVPQLEEIHHVPANAVRQQVPIWKLTDLVLEKKLKNPDLIKIDVEGLEGDVIEGAIPFLEQVKPSVMVEVHSALNGLRTAEQFGKLGYQMQLLGLKGKRKTLPLVLWTHPENPFHELAVVEKNKS